MLLPNAEQAVVHVDKLRDYVLNPTHARGRHKARVFASVLGLQRLDAELLRSAILSAVRTAEAVAGEGDPYGQRYMVDFDWTWNGRRARVRTLWIIRTGDSTPRLTSCFVK